MGVLCWSLFCYVLLYVISRFEIILTGKSADCFAFIVFWESCYCLCPVALSHGAVCWSAACYCGIS